MNPFDALAALAQIAVALAGFSSIIVVFRRGAATENWRPEDIWRFRALLEAGLSAGLLAIVPSLIASFEVDPAELWPRLSLVCAIYTSAYMFRTIRQMRRLPKGSLFLPLAATLYTLAGATIVVQVVSGFGWLAPHSPGPYLLGVAWYTAFAGVAFYRLSMAPIASAQ